ncbi:MAG: PorT family protein [Dysgonamonadaceae bacterium]|jgi:hypothetical protein|nr:PorT family protein [Dysgonamonadaceae bacterium]
MKKYLVFMVMAALLVALPSQAQLKWGLKAGVNLSSVSFGDLESNLDPSNYTGFQVGPMVEFTVPIVGIGMDAALLYSQTGFATPDYGTIKNGDFLLPLNLKYKLNLMGLVGAYATTGPYAGINLFNDGKLDFGGAVASLESKSFKFGWNFGIGVELLSKLQVGVNYQLGITDDFSSLKFNVPGMAGEIGQSKPRVWSITAAVFF